MLERLIFFLLLILVVPFATAEDGDGSKPRDAFVKIVNACDTGQRERWRTGLDLKFHDRFIGRDIRLGERGPGAKISFAGRDELEVLRHGAEGAALARVPAEFQAGHLYTLLVMGRLDAEDARLDVKVIPEYPLPEESVRSGQCRLLFINAVESFPVAISAGRQAPIAIPSGGQLELFLPPGDVDLGILFQDRDGKPQRLQSGLIATADTSYTAVILPSAERPDRPQILRMNTSEEKSRLNIPARENVPR